MNLPRLRPIGRVLRKEEGFGLIETMIAMTMFAIVSAPLVGVLLASITQQKNSHERTLAAQTAQSAIESVRSLPYDSVGVANGNPAGTISAAMPASQLGIQGLDATVTTKVSYMDDAPATSYRTRADYKKVVVTVVRNSDLRPLAQDVTYVAPPGAGAYAGQSQGIVLAQIIDYALNTPIVGATVTVSGGPSPTRTDVADPAGSTVFPSLLPTTVSLNHYDVTTASTGYVTLRDDLPPTTASRTTIVAGQTFNTVLRMYKPATIYIVPKNPDGTVYSGAGTATISSSRGTQSFPFTAGLLTVTSIGGEQVVPSLQYTARILASTGTYSTPTTALVPNAYPTDLTKTFSLTLGGTAGAMPVLTVKVVNAAAVVQANAAVTVSGGPGSNILLTGTTNASGLATFSVPSNSAPGYTTAATLGALTGTATGAVTASLTRTVTIR
jgi:type II secretory pathway pseudopilin PulG